MSLHSLFRKFSISALIAATAISSPIAVFSAQSTQTKPISLIVNGETLNKLPAPPVILDNYTLVPAREVFEKTGATVDWNPETKEVFVNYMQKRLIIQIDNRTANIDGQTSSMEIPPKIINSKTMIPLRFVSESFGFQVDWDSVSRTAKVDSSTAMGAPVIDIGLLQEMGNASAIDVPGYVDVPVAQNPEETPAQTPEETPEPTPPPQPPTASPTPPPVSQGVSLLPAVDLSPGDLPVAQAGETQILNVKTPADNGSNYYSIEASSEISKVTKSLLSDNRLILDIYNAESKLITNEISVNDLSVDKIRSAQNQVDPVKITRVVFELKGGAEYRISLSPDRKTIIIGFERNSVTGVEFSTDGNFDYVTLAFKNVPGANVYPLHSPERIIIDIPNAEMQEILEKTVSGQLVSAMHTSQFDAVTARVSLDLKDTAMFQTFVQGNSLTVKIASPTFKNIAYDAVAKTIQIKKNSNNPIPNTNWTHVDNYPALTYTVVLPGDYTSAIGFGEYMINDIYIKSITIQNNANGNTELVLKENRVLAYTLSEDEQYYYIKAMLPTEKYKRVVVLDAGHGGEAPGTVGNGLVEKEINMDIINRVYALFNSNDQVKAYLTRTGDYNVGLEERAIFGNSTGDLFVSVHINSADKNTTANGTETFYTTHDNDATIGISSKQVAEILRESLIRELGTQDRKSHDRNLVVTKYSKIPATLLEIEFLSNPAGAAKLASDDFRQKAAQAIYNGIIDVYKIYKP